jgi:hypothetical protein
MNSNSVAEPMKSPMCTKGIGDRRSYTLIHDDEQTVRVFD